MKFVLSLLFYMVVIVLISPSDSINPKTKNDQSEMLFPCLAAKQQTAEEECRDMASKMSKNYYAESMSYCIDVTERTEGRIGSSMKQECETRFFRQVYVTYSDCIFSKIGPTEIAMDPVDKKSLSDAIIETSNLESTRKTAALADFTACMAGNDNLPYLHYSFRSDKNPAVLRKYTEKLNKHTEFSKSKPPPAVLAVDCIASALVQNGCAPESEKTVAKLADKLYPPAMLPNPERWMECLNDDRQWFNDICGTLVWSELAPQWSQDCTKGNQPSKGVDNTCRIKRMKQFLEFTSGCLMQKSKAISKSYFFKLFNKKDPVLYKNILIDQSTLPEEQKAKAKTFFDTCMAENITLPYKVFRYDVKAIPGPPVMKDIMNFINKMFSIGNQSPTTFMRADDCVTAALLLNGCNQKKSNESATEIFVGLSWLDKVFDVLNHF